LFILDSKESDMESLVNTIRSQGPGYSVQVLVLVLSILGSPLALAQRAREDVNDEATSWAEVYSRLARNVPRSFSGNRALIRIGVNRGEVTLVGLVESELMKGVAEVQAQTVPLVRSVDNQLVVREKSS
jgi:hypothetical protein